MQCVTIFHALVLIHLLKVLALFSEELKSRCLLFPTDFKAKVSVTSVKEPVRKSRFLEMDLLVPLT